MQINVSTKNLVLFKLQNS